MKNVQSYNGYNYVNISSDHLKVGDTILFDSDCGRVVKITTEGIHTTAFISGHPYATEVTEINNDPMFHLVVRDQDEWDARQEAINVALESLNS